MPEREVMEARPPEPKPAPLSQKMEPMTRPSLSVEDYRIGAEDVLSVFVWNHEDLSMSVPVSQNGDFTFPLIGQVKAAGRTAADVQKEMIRRLGEGYLVRPQVTVTVKEFKSQKVDVVGEVKNPGTFVLTGPTSAMEVLSKAGGPTDKAGSEALVVRATGARGATDQARSGEVIPLDLRAMQGGDVSQDVRVQHGDTVIVPKGNYFYVFGEVKSPGQFQYDPGITVLKAITIAGGITEKAAARRATVVREKEGVRVEMPVKMSDLLEPHDIVMVPESFF
jgi:polysaccharide biosynthesis/export protein